MKQSILVAAWLLVVLITGTSCKKDHTDPGKNFTTPATAAPEGLAGNWASGFQSMTQVIDVYTGKYLGNTWQSGKFFKITQNGKNAEFYYTVETQYAQSATKAIGTIAFDEGSTSTEGSFVFYAGWAHYNGWGTTRVNRDATASELADNLTARYSYFWDGQWLRIQPGEPPAGPYASSFSKIN